MAAASSSWGGGVFVQKGSRETLGIGRFPGKRRSQGGRIVSLRCGKGREPLLVLCADREGCGGRSGKGLKTFDVGATLESGRRLSELSTWGIGGPAKYFVEVHDETQMASILRYCQSQGLRYFVVGKGSNCLFDDRGFDGCVILNSLDFLELKGDGIYRTGSGYAFNRLGARCSKDGFTGLEFASGVPGTVGGAVFMNASANGQETASVLKSVEIMTADEQRIVHTVNGCTSPGYGYRRSPYQTMSGFFAIVAATFEAGYLIPGTKDGIVAVSLLNFKFSSPIATWRRRSQPLTEKSAGCVFRNPGTGSLSAGALIDQAGLKGISIGQARVSETHANFLLNTGSSRADDMLALINHVKERVLETLGVQLTEEVIYVPYR